VNKLKHYFDMLSDKNELMTIKEFSQAFSEKSYMKRVIISLFNFLDRDQNGEVSFEDLLMRLYPNLSQNQLVTVQGWIKQYQKTFQLDLRLNHQELKEKA